jgi:hypothetical protein
MSLDGPGLPTRAAKSAAIQGTPDVRPTRSQRQPDPYLPFEGGTGSECCETSDRAISFRLEVRKLHDPAPLLSFVGDELGEVGNRH